MCAYKVHLATILFRVLPEQMSRIQLIKNELHCPEQFSKLKAEVRKVTITRAETGKVKCITLVELVASTSCASGSLARQVSPVSVAESSNRFVGKVV
jgi:hypothetical protein